MADRVPAAADRWQALHDSAPRRDFSRPADGGHEAVEQRFVLSFADAVPADFGRAAEAAAGWLTACAMVLLARHAGRDTLIVVQCERGSTATGARWAEPTLNDGPSVRQLALALSLPDGAGQPFELAPGQDVPGVVLDVAAAGLPPAPPVAADLTVRLHHDGVSVQAVLIGNAMLYRSQAVGVLARQLQHVLRAATRQPDLAAHDVPLHDDAERLRILRGFNDNRAPFDHGQTLHGLIAARAAQAPSAIGLVHGEQRLSFGELDRQANRLAHWLVEHGAGPGRFVAVLDRRGLHFVVAVLAVWKAGAAYVPIDPGYPAERVRYMLDDSRVAQAIVGGSALPALSDLSAHCAALRHVICLDRLDAIEPLGGADAGPRFSIDGPAALQALPDDAPGLRGRATDPAYMLYTSGSTGRPKGAVVRHDGAVNHILAQALSLGRAAVSRFLQSAPPSSDISVWQFAAPLVLGGTAVIVDDVTDLVHLLAQVRRHRLAVVELVPVVLRHLIDHLASLPQQERELPDLQWMMVTGESASVDLVNHWLALYPQIPVVNAYGPTEAADDVAQAILHTPLPPRQLTVPIGRSLANIDVHVLDTRLEPVPIGVVGEICIAGVGVGDGYWRQPEKTRQSFVANPFEGGAGPVLYRSGDLGRYDDDGRLECLGRVDHQIQLRGVRIELQEIEAVLRGHPGVLDAAAQVFREAAGGGRLVAYFVAAAATPPDAQMLRDYLAARLAPTMLPAALVRLDRLPLNPAGKVDRGALVPPPVDDRPASPATPASVPATAAEQALATAWQQELGRARVGRDDDFFDLGGDSLAALAVAVAVRRLGWQLRPADVFEHPTLARLAAVARPLPVQATPAPERRPAPADDERTRLLAAEPRFEAVAALTPAQQGIYLHALLARDKSVYIDQYVFDLHGPLDAELLERCWNRLVARHPALRTVFLRRGLSEPVQAVLRSMALSIERVDADGLDERAAQARWKTLLARELDSGLRLDTPPLMRLALFRAAPCRHRLVWTHHHIVLDGWSLSIVIDELGQLYRASLAGQAMAWPEPVRLAAEQTGSGSGDDARRAAFWRAQLGGRRPDPSLAADAAANGALPGHGEVEFQLDPASTATLATTARRTGVTLTTLVQAAWACVLAAHSGDPAPVFGVVSSGREGGPDGIERAVGLFVSSLPLRLDTSRRDSVQRWLLDFQRQAAAVREHEGSSLPQLRQWLALAPGATLFDTLFVMSNYPSIATQPADGLRFEAREFRTVPAYPLSVIVTPGRSLAVRLVFDRQHLTAPTADLLAADYRRHLATLAAGGDPRPAGPLHSG